MAESGLSIDACIIGTPDKHHHEMAIKAMRYGWHILLVKPMGQTIRQCNDIVQVSQEFINAIQEGHLQTRTSGTTPFLSHKICLMAE